MSLIMNAADDLTLTLIYAGFGILTLFLFVSALTGRDIRGFDQLRESSPKTYQKLKTISRTNGVLVMLMTAAGFLASPLALNEPDGGWPLAIFMATSSAVWFWLSLRWYRWGRRP